MPLNNKKAKEEMLIERKGLPKGYYETILGNKRYSVVDFGTTMKSHPMPAGIFLGWEAILVEENGELNSEKMFRANSWEELYKQL